MAILLLGECSPYRSATRFTDVAFCNSQGRMLASACNLTVHELLQLVDGKYLLNKYVHSSQRRKHKHFGELFTEWDLVKGVYLQKYDLILLVGKRLCKIVVQSDLDFFEYSIWGKTLVSCVPNPMAEIWWKDDEHIKAVKEFMDSALCEYV